jgi:hypothetical protein
MTRPLPLLLIFPLLAACDSSELEDLGRDDEFEAGCDASEAVSVDARGTYLLTQGDTPNDPTVLDLDAFGIEPGDRLVLQRLGEYQYAQLRDPASVRAGMVAVFSRTDTVRDEDERERVPGAIDAGRDVETRRTFAGNAETDIDQDFAVDSTTVTVPSGAAFLFVSPDDDKFDDNADDDDDFRICVTETPADS